MQTKKNYSMEIQHSSYSSRKSYAHMQFYVYLH